MAQRSPFHALFSQVDGRSVVSQPSSSSYDIISSQAAIFRRRLRLGTLLDVLCGSEEADVPFDSLLVPHLANTQSNVAEWLKSISSIALDRQIHESRTHISTSSEPPTGPYGWDHLPPSFFSLNDLNPLASPPTVDPLPDVSSFDFRYKPTFDSSQRTENSMVTQTRTDHSRVSNSANEKSLDEGAPQWYHPDQLSLSHEQPQRWDEFDIGGLWSVMNSFEPTSSSSVTRASSPGFSPPEPNTSTSECNSIDTLSSLLTPEASSLHPASSPNHYPNSYSLPSSAFSTPPISRRPSFDSSSSSAPVGGKICSHCKATSTPLWRRNSTTLKALCNACGLYLQQRSKLRPQELIDADAAEGSADDDHDESLHDVIGPQCSHCHTRKTSVWRRSKEGKQLCNACGVYARLKGKDRPLSLKRNRIKPRSKHARKP